MRILLLAPELLPTRGGIGVYLAELIRGLPPEVELTVLTVQRREGSEAYSEAEMEAVFGHRARIHVLSEARDSFLYNAGFQLAVLRWMRSHLGAERYDLIHTQHAHMPDVLSRMVRSRPPTIRTVHTTIAGQREGILTAQQYGGALERSERWQVALLPALDLAEWAVLSRHDFTITVSDWMRRILVAQGHAPDRVVVVHLPIDTERFRPLPEGQRPLRAASGGRIVLFSGRPTAVKGAAILAQAIPLVLREVPGTEFVFTGARKEEFLPLLGESPEALPSIRFLGFLPFPEMPGVVASADVCVVPSLYENTPTRMLEAMSCAVPPVASAVCGIPEVLRDGHDGLLVPPGYPQRLAEALVRLLQDDAARRQMGVAARETIERGFSRALFADGTTRAYRQAIDAGR
jgi:glycosyltransferase involved in cell wall biosynthesis